MSTLSDRYVWRITVIFGGLVCMIALLVIPPLVESTNCILSSPYTAHSPIALVCVRPFWITQFDDENFNISQIDATQYLVSPALDWTTETTFTFTAKDAILRTEKGVRMAVPPLTSGFFVSTTTHPGDMTTVFRVNATHPDAVPEKIFSAPGISHLRFDGVRYFTFIQNDEPHDARSQAWRYDPLLGTKTPALPVRQGKSVLDFIPFSDPTIYAWVEETDDHRRSVSYINGRGGGVHNLAIMDQRIQENFDTAVFSQDAKYLMALDHEHNQAVLYDVLDNISIAASPVLYSSIKGIAFTGQNGDIPTLWTDSEIWTFYSGAWTHSDAQNLLAIKSCGGQDYYLSQGAFTTSSSTTSVDTAAYDLVVTNDCHSYMLGKALGLDPVGE